MDGFKLSWALFSALTGCSCGLSPRRSSPLNIGFSFLLYSTAFDSLVPPLENSAGFASHASAGLSWMFETSIQANINL